MGRSTRSSDGGSESVKTPCIGICSTTSLGDRICRGCKRFAVEVIDWNRYTPVQKRAVLMRLDKLIGQIMSTRFVIINLDALTRSMRQHGVPAHPELSAHCWLHSLLKKRHHQLASLADIGAGCHADYVDLPWQVLWQQADTELLMLSEAHRARYFPATGQDTRKSCSPEHGVQPASKGK